MEDLQFKFSDNIMPIDSITHIRA